MKGQYHILIFYCVSFETVHLTTGKGCANQ